MATYNGIFMRSSLNQLNTIPRPGAQSNSPDIIPYGIFNPDDPQKYFKDTYEQDVGKLLEANKTNYIYLRGKNYAAQDIDDSGDNRPRLYWTKASLLSYPNKWNELTQTGSRQPVSLKVPANGGIGVISEPLIWVPDNIDNDHYCMIASVPSPGYDNSIPNTLQISDLAGWVAKSGGVAWRNVTVINSKTLTLTGEKLFYQQGTEAGTMEFTIKCVNVPIDTVVSFSAGKAGPVPPIQLKETKVSTYPSFNTGIECQVPANYESDIYFNLVAPSGVTSLPDAKVTIQATYTVSGESELYAYGMTRQELGMPSPDEAYAMIWRQLLAAGKNRLEPHHEQYLEQLTDLFKPGNKMQAADRKIVVGQNNYDWKTI
ncbi:hypothetical protein [Mucilaginibacter gotjawali]|uniref:Uncharacterized protein n=1 Tax=Mucilaginibacter gotjawali TaxID=1550579 RepID=A0A839S9V6_9SPHI|nr:hypothetical protein [Mucilaginibacter gotjawali]MBB3053760.1 hypothetical protein [Mucilaginibacter gotjawali]